MPQFSSPAILIRRLDYGDYDLIITFLTQHRGKITSIAKSAKRSTKRFGGVLELFSLLDIVISEKRGKGLSVLTEASLSQPLSKIRSDINKTAYASYWVELINEWMEVGEKHPKLYHLLRYVLEELDLGETPEEALSILFQMRLLTMAGLAPNLKECCICGTKVENMKNNRVNINPVKGGLVCENCVGGGLGRIRLSKGTIKQLLWIERGDLKKAVRIRFNQDTINESLEFLETFVPYHLESEPRSLKFLRQIRA